MLTSEIINSISNDFQSTFGIIDETTIRNLLSGKDLPEVESIIKKYLQDVRVEFIKTNQLSLESNKKDIWIVKIHSTP